MGQPAEEAPSDSPQPPQPAPVPEEWGWTGRQRIGLGILISLLLAFLVVQYIRRPFRLGDTAVLIDGNSVTLPQRIDPNTATQEQLARIPHLGDAISLKIIQYRDARKSGALDGIVFRQLSDLDAISGIGPKLLEQFEPFFQFPGTPPDINP